MFKLAQLSITTVVNTAQCFSLFANESSLEINASYISLDDVKVYNKLRRLWENVEECMCYEYYSYDYN